MISRISSFFNVEKSLQPEMSDDNLLIDLIAATGCDHPVDDQGGVIAPSENG